MLKLLVINLFNFVIISIYPILFVIYFEFIIILDDFFFYIYHKIFYIIICEQSLCLYYKKWYNRIIKRVTPIDLEYKIHTNIGNMMIGVFVNDEYELVKCVLYNKGRVRIVTDNYSFWTRKDWIEKS